MSIHRSELSSARSSPGSAAPSGRGDELSRTSKGNCGGVASSASITTTSTDGSQAVSLSRPLTVRALLSSECPIAVAPGLDCPRLTACWSWIPDLDAPQTLAQVLGNSPGSGGVDEASSDGGWSRESNLIGLRKHDRARCPRFCGRCTRGGFSGRTASHSVSFTYRSCSCISCPGRSSSCPQWSGGGG